MTVGTCVEIVCGKHLKKLVLYLLRNTHSCISNTYIYQILLLSFKLYYYFSTIRKFYSISYKIEQNLLQSSLV
jgi:hypothetical protein